MPENGRIALFDPEKARHLLMMVPTSLIHADQYDRFEIPTLPLQFDVYGPTKLDDPNASWKIVWTGEEDVKEHMPFARLSYTKGLGWWDGCLRRIVSEKGREMLIGPVPPALPLLEHAGLGVSGHIKKYLGRLRLKHGNDDGHALLFVQPEEEADVNFSQLKTSYDYGAEILDGVDMPEPQEDEAEKHQMQFNSETVNIRGKPDK